jgi:dipeptidyl aminopeptidase/acylaminoacyl peptidase
MRRILSCLFILSLGCGSTPEQPASPPPSQPAPATTSAPTAATKAPAAPVPLEDYFRILRIGGGTFSHDEKWIAFSSDQGGRPDIWIAPVEGGEARQLTKVEGFVHSFAFSPAEDHLAYEADQGGNELPHLYLTNSKGDAPKDLAAGDPPYARTQFVQWADDGKTLLYLSNRRDQKYLDLYEHNMKTGKAELLWTSADKMAFALASRDAKRFIIMETLSDSDNNLYLVERGKKTAPVLLTKHTGEALFDPTEISKDGKTLFYTSDQKGEFTALYSMDLASKKSKPMLEADWDVEYGRFSQGWKYFYTQTNVDGALKIEITDAKTKKKVDLPGSTPERSLRPIAFSKSDRYLAAAVVTDASPQTTVVIDLQEKTSVQIAEPLPESLQDQPMLSGRSVRMPTFDERTVPAYVYSPPGDGPFPAVIFVHGGPTAQSRRQFDPFRHYLVSKGYVVLVPNVRGSTGYGKTYTKLDNLDLGGGPLQDVVHAKKWLVKEAKVDENKVVVLGGSYGGYMALAAATFTPNEFAAHVDYFGVSDLKSLVESFPPYWAAFATFIYKKFGDPKNPEHAQYQRDRSPLNFIDKIQRPLLVVQGENDARVKKDQSDRVIAKLKERKVPVHYLVLAGEGHGFSRNENRLAAYRATDRFLDRYIFGDTSVEVLSEPAGASAPAASR